MKQMAFLRQKWLEDEGLENAWIVEEVKRLEAEAAARIETSHG